MQALLLATVVALGVRATQLTDTEQAAADAARLGAERCDDFVAPDDGDEPRPPWWCPHGGDGGRCVKGCKPGLSFDERCECTVHVDPNGAWRRCGSHFLCRGRARRHPHPRPPLRSE